MHRQMVTSFKGEIYFGSIPTLIFNQWEPVYNMEAFCKQALVWKVYLGILELVQI